MTNLRVSQSSASNETARVMESSADNTWALSHI